MKNNELLKDGSNFNKKLPVLLLLLLISLILFVLLLINNQIKFEKEKSSIGGDETEVSLNQKLKNQDDLKKFSDYSRLKDFLADNLEASNADFDRRGGEFMPTPEAMDKSSEALDQEADNASSASIEHSETNIQVKGVDEADIVKNDGEFIYSVADKNLYISRAYPAEEAEVLAKIAFKSRPQNIYLKDDKLVVFGAEDRANIQEDSVVDFGKGVSFLKVFDISNKRNPTQTRDLQFEGNYFDSRMIDNHIYFITSSPAYSEDAPIPGVFENGRAIYNSKEKENCQNCPDVYYVDAPSSHYEYVNVSSVDINSSDSEVENEIYMLPGGREMYVSKENIYLTYTKHISEYQLMMGVVSEVVLPELNREEKEKLEDIQAAPSHVLSRQEKRRKINTLTEKYLKSFSEEKQKEIEKRSKEKLKEKYEDITKELEKTIIQKISIDKGVLEHQASGEVTGHVLNQFSMSEKDDYFRIATTKKREFGMSPALGGLELETEKDRESYSNVYVLDEDLEVIGSVEGLAEEERIYSARFMQDRLYLVTFKQTDPLFVVDLKDPENPKVLGELKIPGYSNYLHPYDENTLIGLGKETKARETGGFDTKGLKLSLFDVSDVSNPKETDKYVFEEENSSSIAQHDHKAFLFSKEKNLLAIPVSIQNEYIGIPRPIPMDMNESAESPEKETANQEVLPPPDTKNFRGAAVFSLKNNKIELKGMIDHSGENEKRMNWCGPDCYDTTVKRSLYIEDNLYTVSDRFMKINKIEDLEQIKRIELKKEKEEDYEVVN